MSDHILRTEEELREVIGPCQLPAELLAYEKLEPEMIEFVERSPLLLLATADKEGRQTVSPKGDGPGFVLLEDEATLLVPDRKGNKQLKGLLNILENPEVGVIFLCPGTSETLRVNGTAEITRDPEVLERLSTRGQPALLAIRLHMRECFFHCAKALIRSSLWKPETWTAKQKISFGRMFARKHGAGDKLAQDVDAAVEEDYRNNL